MIRVIRSEWTKLWSLRSSWIALVGLPVVLVAVSAVIGWNNRGRTAPPTLAEAVGGGFLLFALVIGIFGALTMTGEYAGGLIRVTLAAVPRRLPVLWAKAIALVAATAPSMVFAYLLAFLANQAFAQPAARLSLSDPHVAGSILAAAVATVATGLMGLAIGTLLRSTAGAVVVYVCGLVIVPQALWGALPGSLQPLVLPYVPTVALQAMFQFDANVNPLFGALVVVGWVVALMAGAAVLLRVRDA